MQYGDLPVPIGKYRVDCGEMMFYQYLPIKLIGQDWYKYEKRLSYFWDIIEGSCVDFISNFGMNKFKDSYIYVTAKYMYQESGCSYNREGYHSDGFLTDDINYIWSDRNPTTFNTSRFNLTLDDKISLVEMDSQAGVHNDIQFENNTLLRLNQFNIHKVSFTEESGMRAFVKISFSKDRYDLQGNSINYLLGYNWDYKERKIDRNIPQTIITL
jgi:hypothetical protein